MSAQRGVIGQIEKGGKTVDCVYVTWHTKDPVGAWYVNASNDTHALIRCRLISLLDRRPHEVNHGFTQDAWSFEILDNKTFSKIANGYAPIPRRKV